MFNIINEIKNIRSLVKFLDGRPVYCFPIEVERREIDVKLYLASQIVSGSNNVVFFGDITDVRFDFFRNATFLYKDHAIWSESMIKRWKRNVNRVYCLDEEGVILGDDTRYKRSRVSQSTCDMVDAIFTSSGRQYSLIKEKSPNAKLIKSGHPRFDFARIYGSRATTGRPKWPINILLNTRFGLINNFSDNYTETLVKIGYLERGDELTRWTELLDNEVRIFEEFKKVLQNLRNSSEFKITIRPHPAEKVETYVQFCCDNISIDTETYLLDQIAAHDIILHDGCTTGIEAFFTRKAVVSLRPLLSGDSYDGLANQFSINFESAGQFQSWLHTILVDSNFSLEQIKPAVEIYRTSARSGYASEAITSELLMSELVSSWRPKFTVRLLRSVLKLLVISLGRNNAALGRILTKVLSANDASESKFPSRALAQLEADVLERLGSLEKRFNANVTGVRVKAIGRRAFLLYSSNLKG